MPMSLFHTAPCLLLTIHKACLIDRYDGRALLDIMPAPPASSSVPLQDELLLERHVKLLPPSSRSHTRSFLNFERYRDLGGWGGGGGAQHYLLVFQRYS